MGYRAHTITQHREYGNAVFYDIDLFEKYFCILQERYEGKYNLFTPENEDYFEIPKEVVMLEIKRLQALEPSELSEYEDEVTNEELIERWREALAETPKDYEFVALEWY